MNLKKIEKLWKKILVEIGENPERTGLLETPHRIAKMYSEIFRGYDPKQKPNLTVFDNNDDGIVYDDIIMDSGKFFSQCEHHCAVFKGDYFFGYIPSEKIVGLSKIARLVDYFAAKMQIQERLGREIVNEIDSILKPKGIILILKAHHTCKEMRGVKKDGEMTTVIATGLFKTEPILEQKFISLINNK